MAKNNQMRSDVAKIEADFNEMRPSSINAVKLLNEPMIYIAIMRPCGLGQGEVIAGDHGEVAIHKTSRQLDVIIAHDNVLKVV